MSKFCGCYINGGGMWRPGRRQRLRLAWQAWRGPGDWDAVLHHLDSNDMVVTVGPGGYIEVCDSDGEIVLGPGCVIRDRPGGGFTIEIPGDSDG